MSHHYFIDLFSGAGGFTEGLKQAGFKHLVGVEIDSLFASTYEANHGNVIVGDIRDVNLASLLGEVDKSEISLIAASPPCQSFSTCGTRTSGDPRDSLYQEVIRVVKGIRPRWVLIENVTGLLTKRETKDGPKIIDTMLDDLRRIGYHAAYRVLSADDYEVPQRRKRVIIVGALNAEDLTFPEPVPRTTFNPAVVNVLTPEIDVPKKYFWPEHRRAYFDRKPQYVRYLEHDETCCTIRACYAKNRGADACIRYSKDNVRMLTERECAAIQTFPATYIFKGSMSNIYRQIGNAIPVNLARHVGQALLRTKSLDLAKA